MLKLSKGRIHVKAEAVTLANAAAVSTFIFGLPNSVDAVTDAQGWTTIPFGIWPHAAGYQRFGMKEAEAIVDSFKSGWGRLKRAIVGLPIFKGHPDNPDMANLYPDRTEYGQIADMEVRDNGLALKQVLGAAGATLVANGRDRISPNWYVRDTGERKNDRPIFEPVAIKSVGLVAKPNIPNLSLVNSKDTEPMKDALLAILKALFPSLTNESADADVVAAVTELAKRPLPAALANAQNETAAARAELATVKSDRDAQKVRADAGATLLANEKAAKTKASLDAAIKSGRITAAERPTWETVLANDFDGGSKILESIPKKVKTEPRARSADLADADRHAREAFANGDTGADGANPGADGNMMNRGAKIQKLVDAEMTALGHHPGMSVSQKNSIRNRAWANVKRQMPGLFAPAESGRADGSRGGEDGEDGKE